MSEFGFIPPRHDLKFQNRVLIELSGRAAVEIIAIWQAVNEIQRIPATFSEDGSCVITCRVTLPVQRDAWNKLQEIEIISSVDRHIFDLLGGDGASGRGNRSVQKRNARAHFDRLTH